MCGKDLCYLLSILFGQGSPPHVREGPRPEPLCNTDTGITPHVREELEGTKIPLNWLGITPARAGRTRLLDLLYKIVEDHPRSRGKD